jgi:hypothetical protein
MKKSGRAIGAVAVIALFLFAVPAIGQYKPTGDDGITASPKVRQMLNERKLASPGVVARSNSDTMPCAKCKDEYVKRTDWAARGATKPAILVVKHLCDSCETTFLVAGVGKGKHDVAARKCSSYGVENLACCSTGNSVATKGMERRFDVAPIK